MQFYCITDNIDTQIGMRLVGIQGEVVHTLDEFKASLKYVSENQDIGIILITEKVIKLAPDIVKHFKLNKKIPLIVEIPDRHGTSKISESISKYVKDAIGIKI